jgi:hypothetical protein
MTEFTNEVCELDIDQLDSFSGGMDPNYKFCWNGPAGTGTYPNYVDCGGGGKTNAEVYKAFFDAFHKAGGH